MHIDSERMRKLIKKNVQEVEPTAQVWLYGSRVRGKAREDSDWDVLVLSAKKKPFLQGGRAFYESYM